MSKQSLFAKWLSRIGLALTAAFLLVSLGSLTNAAAPPPQIVISNVPMTLVVPAHPQVMIAVTNSESMDGNLSGAIMTGSGEGSVPSQLNASSSPVNFTVPAGFTPPISGGATGSPQPYTATCGAHLCDNSPSRLNVAKESITSILQTYSGVTDFGLADYQTGGPTLYKTWVYEMSNAGGFTFSATNTPAPPVGEYIANPCYLQTGATTVATDCSNMTALLGPTLLTMPYMLVQFSSDDPTINDVLYTGGEAPVCVVYGSVTPANPYTFYGLGTYNSGGIRVTYGSEINTCARTTGPTNAGFVPFQPQTMYMQRGFGYIGSATADPGAGIGNVLQGVITAGQNPTPAQITTYVAHFTPFLAPETNSTGTGEIKSVAVQSPVAGILKGALNYYKTVNPPSSNGCTPLRFVILISDGLPTEDLNGKNWPPLGSAAAKPSPSGYGVSATFDPVTGALTATNDQALTDTIAQLAALNTDKIQTFIIGMGAGVNPLLNPAAAKTLKAMAIAGGSGNYFAATSPAAVTAALSVILATIQGENLASSSAAVNSTGLNSGSTAYQAQFTSSDTPDNDWTGNLVAYPINPDGSVNLLAPKWNAQALLDAQTSGSGWQSPTRVIATWDPAANAGIPFGWCTSMCGAGSIDASTALGLDLMTSPTDVLGQDRLDYLRGDQSNEAPAGDGFRARSHRLGDIVDSNPLFISASNGPYTSDPSYVSYESSKLTRRSMIYAGANDGMLHAFNATTGQEQFAFIPNGVFANLIKLTSPVYNAQHQFYVDGSPTAGDVKFADSTWHTILVGGLNDGGNSIYALDVTTPESLTSETAVANAVMWEYSDPSGKLGLTYSRPFIAQTSDTTDAPDGFMVLFGSGYNNSDGNPYLYALNAQTGAVVSRDVSQAGNPIGAINLCAANLVQHGTDPCNHALANGLSSVTAVNSGGGLGVPATTVYAGDLQGNLWKVDISDPNPANWKVALLFQARDASGNPQPITTTPAVSLNPNFPRLSGPLVFFGTGQFLGPSDITNVNVQTFYAIWDNGSTVLPTRTTTLVQQTLTDNFIPGPPVVEARTITNNPVDFGAGKRGWYIDLGSAVSPADAGERVITDPRLENGRVVFTTYTPSNNTCTAGGGAFLMTVNYKNGGSFPQPELDINGDGVINSSDQILGQNPVGLGLGNVYATAPTILSASLPGNITAVKLITESGTAGTIIKKVAEHGGGQRTAWRQLQLP